MPEQGGIETLPLFSTSWRSAHPLEDDPRIAAAF
jgi:hypothetical protein